MFEQTGVQPIENARQPLPPKGGASSGRALERDYRALLASLASVGLSRPLAFGGAPRFALLPPWSASPPSPSRGLARSGVPPSRLGRAVGLSPCFLVRCRLRRPLLRRLAAAGCKQGWAIGAGMNLALAGQEPYPPLSPCMQPSYYEKDNAVSIYFLTIVLKKSIYF